jgi:integrase
MNGEGSIYRRASDGRWVAALSVGGREDRVIHRRYARTRAEARIRLDELRAGETMTSTATVGDFLERWVSDARNIRPTTRSGYRAAITKHIDPTIGHLRLVDLTPLDVERMLADLQGSMSPKTLRNAHAVLRRGLGQAVRAGLIQRNVASREYVDAPKVTDSDPRVLTPDEERRLVAAAQGDRMEALIVTALGTGLRLGELLGLAWEDIEPSRLRVRKELVYRDGRYHREDPKTPRSKRTVPLAPHVAAALAAHRDRLIAAGYVPTSTGPVFVNTTGGALSGSWVTHHFYDLLAAAKVNRLPFKNLRSTFSSRLYGAGVPDRTIADLMGHTKVRTTQKHYIATTPEQAIEAVARLAG